jgi:hypothetical protein
VRHGCQQFISAPQHADPHRAEHLVTAEGEKVDAETDHVHGQVRHGLAGIQDRERTDLAGPVDDGSDGGDGAENIGDMGERDDLGAVGDHRVQIGEVEAAIVGDADPAQRGPGASRELLPRHEVGVMLHLGDHDLVARAEGESRSDQRVNAVHRAGSRSIAERVGHKIYGLGGILGEHDLLGRSADERGHALASGFEFVGGLFGKLVSTAMNSGIVLFVERTLRIENLAWFV